ncbi:hypothetical protein ACFPYJ_25105 [Paenibacillus solisilvae]|uniref:CTP synthase (glutamine hydrolyzing) n=1 Tax=Paenibacillus solisilvae TaxID=2486751 RepID=A0ABW0W6J1_9BACL
MKIGIIGDYNPESPTHQATTMALAHSAAKANLAVETEWLPTASIAGKSDEWLNSYHGLWIAPGVPDSVDGVLHAITFAREHDVPLLGTCAGFQFIIMEFARNVLGMTDVHHEEYNSGANHFLISKLSCSLAGQEGQVLIKQQSAVHRIYQSEQTIEAFRCSYGLDASYAARLNEAGLCIVGSDLFGEPRIVELPSHRFFIGTLYVPQLHSACDQPHCLVDSFMLHAATRQVGWAYVPDNMSDGSVYS